MPLQMWSLRSLQRRAIGEHFQLAKGKGHQEILNVFLRYGFVPHGTPFSDRIIREKLPLYSTYHKTIIIMVLSILRSIWVILKILPSFINIRTGLSAGNFSLLQWDLRNSGSMLCHPDPYIHLRILLLCFYTTFQALKGISLPPPLFVQHKVEIARDFAGVYKVFYSSHI